MENPGYNPDNNIEISLDGVQVSYPVNGEKNANTEKAAEDFNVVLYRRRWIILAIFSLISLMNEVIWISLSAVSTVVKDYYQVTFCQVNWLGTTFSALYFTVIFAVFILNKYGLKVTIVGGALCNAIGSAFRMAGYARNGFTLTFIGNVIGGIGQSFLIFIPPTLSALWFGEGERAKASSIGMAMNMLGVALGFLMGSMFVVESKDYDGIVKAGMFKTMLIQVIICGVLLIASLIFIKSEPPTPPTYTQALNIQRRKTKGDIKGDVTEEKEKGEKAQSTGFFKNWKVMAKNPSFHFLTQAFGLYFAMFVTFSTLLNQMVNSHFKGKVWYTGLMGFSSILCGQISMLLSGYWLDRTRRYKLITVFIFAACSFTSVTFTLILKYSNNFKLTFLCYSLHGFVSFPFLAIGLEFLAEIMYPIKENYLSFISFFLGTLYGVVVINVLGVITHTVGADIAGYIIAGFYVIGFVLVCFVKEDLKRYNIDKVKNGNA